MSSRKSFSNSKSAFKTAITSPKKVSGRVTTVLQYLEQKEMDDGISAVDPEWKVKEYKGIKNASLRDLKDIVEIEEKSFGKHPITREKTEENVCETFSPPSLTPFKPRFSEIGVYLTDSLFQAVWYAVKDEEEEENVCVFEVDVKSLPNNIRFGHDGYGAIMTDGSSIPPKYLKLFKVKDIKEKLVKEGLLEHDYDDLIKEFQ
jgi:hypothetical protein